MRQYTEEHYLPAAAAWRERSAAGAGFAAGLLDWQRALAAHWPHVRFGGAKTETADGAHILEVQVYLDELDPEAVQVELCADPDVRHTMTRGQQLVGERRGVGFARPERPAGALGPDLRGNLPRDRHSRGCFHADVHGEALVITLV